VECGLLGSFVDVMFLWNVALQKFERVERSSERAKRHLQSIMATELIGFSSLSLRWRSVGKKVCKEDSRFLDHTRLSIEHWHCGHTKRDEEKVLYLREVDGGVGST
jgi:hypothetical protein